MVRKKRSGFRAVIIWSGFSLIELITVIAIMAVFIVILAPSLIQYVERARAQRDASATSEIVNAVRIAMTKEDVYDEVLRYSRTNNVSCYVDESKEEVYKNNRIGGSYSRYSFDDLTRTADATPYYAAGNMRGVTITFEPLKRSKGSAYVIKDGVINKFIPPLGQKFSELTHLCSEVRIVVGDEVPQISRTYRNSEFTVFIGANGEFDTIQVYGQYSGTNLTEDHVENHIYTDTEDRSTSDDDFTDDNNDGQNPNPGYDEGDLDGSGRIGGDTACIHTSTEVSGASEATCASTGYTGDERCVSCGIIVNEGEVIPKKEHEGKTENYIAATCTSAGYTGDSICQMCGLTLKQGQAIPITEHVIEIIEPVEPTCNTNGKTEGKICKNCKTIVEEAEVISALGHSYVTPEWNWNDVSSARVVFTCERCSHEEAVDATMKTNIIAESCETDGEIAHIATVSFGGKTYSDCKREIVGAIGHDLETMTIPPTCVEQGYTKYTCKRPTCSYSYDGNYVDALGHSVGAEATCDNDQVCTVCGVVVTNKLDHDYEDVVIAPTCTEMGYTIHTCVDCGGSYKDTYVDATGHTFGANATCEAPQICTDCNAVITPALGHDYASVVKSPTCIETGYTTHTCTRCGDSYKDSHTSKISHNSTYAGLADAHTKCSVCDLVLSTVHTYKSSIVVPATCTTKGTTKYSCECGYSYTNQDVPIDTNAHDGNPVSGGDDDVHSKWSCCDTTISVDHNYTNKVTKTATCTVNGERTYTCDCGHSYTEVIPATGHTEINGGTKDAHKKCSVCGTITSVAHNYTNRVTKASTCTAEGVRTYSCGCGYSYTEAIAKIGHTPGNAATCTEAQTCTVCGTQLVAAKGHTEVNGGTEGVHKKCSVCGTTLSSTHTYKSTISIAATCTTKGTTKYTCDCGYTYSKQDIAVNAKNHTGSAVNGGTKDVHTKYSCCGATISNTHNYTNKVTTAATCTKAGVRTYTCGCGYSYTESIAATGHTSVNGGTANAHTKCSVCGTTISSSHSYSTKVTKAATCTAEGVKTHSCACGYSYTETIAKADHTPGDAATCAEAQTCTVCGTQLVAAKGHTEVNGGTEGVHKKCSVCGETLSTTHTYKSNVSIAATCTTKGTTKYTCDCGYAYTKQDVAINANNHTGSAVNGGTKDVHTKYSCCGATISSAHSYTNEVTTAAACATAGVRTYTCGCGYSYTESIASTGHTSVNGGTKDIHTKCSTCGVTLSNAHTYTNKVTKAATCTTDGVKTYTCGCGYSYTEAVAKTGHTEVNGGTGGAHKKCSVCGATLSTAHNYSATVSVAATCTTKGTTKYTCGCGHSYTEQNIAINSNNHTGSAVNGGTDGVHSKYSCCGATISTTHTYTNVATSAQCRKCACGYIDTTHNSVNGGTSGVHTKCSDCGYTISSTHSYTNSVTTAATCTTAGVRTYKCSCGYSYTEAIAAAGHTSTYGGTSSVHAKCSVCGTTLSSSHSYSYSTISYASCTSSGTGKASCSCGYSYTYSISAYGHSSTSGGTSGVHSKCSTCGTTLSSSHSYSSSVTTEATCTSPGVRTYSCGCGYSYTESIAAPGHSPGAAATCTTPQSCTKCSVTLTTAPGHSWVAATCTEPKTCSRCGTTSGTKNGHSWDAATCTTPKTCSKCGKTSGEKLGHNYSSATCTTLQTCSRCGKTKGELASHSYSAATCTSPKTCTACGATSGSKLGHSWNAATCTKAKTCSRCGTTSGSALGHNKGASATCTIAQTCTRCSYVYQAALGHRWITNTSTNKTTCNRCGISYET